VSRLFILGATGMLGATVARYAMARGRDVVMTARDLNRLPADFRRCAIEFDAMTGDLDAVLREADEGDLVVNCVGVIKHLMRDECAADRQRAIQINSLFPYTLAERASAVGARVLQIATDCVYSGFRGGYGESDPHDAIDVYGRSKSLGEVPSSSVMHLRASIIGPEIDTAISLQGWVLGHGPNEVLTGYADHRWNGVTTLAFAKIALAIMDGAFVPGVSHLVPADLVTKAGLCQLILDAHGRDDVIVRTGQSAMAIDRTLRTENPTLNSGLWASAGYDRVPTIAEMVREAAIWELETTV